MALLLTAAVVLITIYTGGLSLLFIAIPVLIMLFIQEPRYLAIVLISIPVLIGYLLVVNKIITFGNKVYDETVVAPRKEQELQALRQKELDRFCELIDKGRFNGDDALRDEIIDYINTKEGIDDNKSWDFVYGCLQSHQFIEDYEINYANEIILEKIEKKIEENLERAKTLNPKDRKIRPENYLKTN